MADVIAIIDNSPTVTATVVDPNLTTTLTNLSTTLQSMSDIGNVDTTLLQNESLLVYKTATGKWTSVNVLNSPTFVNPTLGTPFSGNLVNCTFPILNQNTTGNAATVTNGVYTTGYYTDPTWLAISKSKVGLGNVDNTADANKNVLFAASAGAVPYSGLTGTVPTWNQNTTGNAATVTNGIYTTGYYTDPTWLAISKSKVGLGNVDNTADATKSVLFATTAGSASASDVYAWAKTPTKPTYTASEVGLGNVTNESKATMFTSPTITGTLSAENLTVSNTLSSSNLTGIGANGTVTLAPTGTGTVDVSSKRITSVATPTQPTDAVNKAYVDTVAENLHIHEAANCATTNTLAILSGGTVTYDNGTLGVGATLTLSVGLSTIDGFALSNGNRILVKDQANQAHNGVYVRTSATVLTRASDFDTAAEIGGGDFIFVESGITYASSGWVQTFEVLTVGTDTVMWRQFSGSGTFTAGDGLTLTGSTFNVVGTANRITANVDSIDIASTYVGQSTITTLGTISTGTWNAGIISGTYGGTGVNNGARTITLGGNFTHTGAHTLGLTTTANTSVTLPTSGTLATLAGTEALSNKTITLSSFSGTTVAASGNVTFTSTTDATAVGTAPVVLSGGLSVAKTIYVGNNITGAGPGTLAAPISVIDGFQIDGGTY